MNWKFLIAISLGLLIIGLGHAGALSSPDSKPAPSLPPHKEKPSPTPPRIGGGIVVKTFTGSSSIAQAKSFLNQYWGKLTLRLNLNEFQNVTFVGIALRPLPSGAYAPLYYFGRVGECPADLLKRAFYTELSAFENIPLEVKGSLADEPGRNWKYIGAVRSIRTSREIRVTTSIWTEEKATVYNEFGAEFWVTYGTSGQYVYYAYLSHEGKVPTKASGNLKVAVKNVTESVKVLNSKDAFIGVGSFRPEGSGSTSHSTVTWGLNVGFGVDSTGRPLPNAQAGFTESHSTALSFKWYTDDVDPNSEVHFNFYDLEERGFIFSHPAWGKIFIAHPAVVVHVDPGVTFHLAKLKLKAEALFHYGAVIDSPFSGTYITRHDVEAPPIEFTVEMYPWFINEP
ncbi:hypothetical protein [Thermococcus gammatolerans]|uniref:Uncharacterized protein n=1 Tax=Thermococcus gammatolerans (strain DSM 15229 / JCM 11827 / EJ3) TaxID=593117 RepID=C5A1R2_THEGJ|nr:hypothetical protein [Thermococcus gammatolerans]ACS34331.1 Conserved hypothetical protein [Thermococcus gammatolerans EJ3]